MSLRSKVHEFVHPEWQPSRGDSAIALGSLIGVPLAIGMLFGILTQKDVKGWYRTLKKPSWNPPNWLFGPVWSVNYVLLGYASWSVWTHGGTKKQKIPLGFYAAALLLNLLWTPLFFKARKLDLALIELVAQLGLLSSTIVSFHSIEPLAAVVLLPVWLFTAFALALTFSIFKLNPQKTKRAFQGLVNGLEKLTDNKAE